MSEGDSNGPPLLHCNQDCSAKQKTYRTAVRAGGNPGGVGRVHWIPA